MNRPDVLEREAAAAKGPYGDLPPALADPGLLRFRLSGDADPQLPARILALLSVRAELPLQFGFTRLAADEGIELRFDLLTQEVVLPELLLERLLKLPSVREAALLPPPTGAPETRSGGGST